MVRRRSYYHDFFPKASKPLEAKGGIKSQAKRGTFGTSWWAKRWLAVLESFNIGARLTRGRTYARSGQVLSIKIEKGEVTADVQGSRTKPYKINIKVKTLEVDDWRKLADILSRQAIFAAKLLAGEMPEEIETVFKEAGLSLFPNKSNDLETDCSCPDWSNPCKHIAAVYFLLGEEFDRDPFLIFKLRGMNREDLIALLDVPASLAPTEPQTETHPSDPFPSDPTLFWDGGALPYDLFGEVAIPHLSAALPKSLGSFPFWRGQEQFLSALEPLYENASQKGLKVFLGEKEFT